MNTRSPLLPAVAAGIVLVTGLWACGPFFPGWLLDLDDEQMQRSPRALFGAELERLNGLRPSRFRAVIQTNDHPAETLAAELADLDEALQGDRIPETRRREVVTAYQDERNRLNTLRSQVEAWRAWQASGQVEPAPQWEQPRPPGGTPAEFTGYLQGAIEFVSGRTNEARAAWEGVLALPASERHFRSVWSAYMLGKLDADVDPAAAAGRFQEVRELVRQGFADRIGLGADSLGWEAHTALKLKNYTRAIDLYLEQETGGKRDQPSLLFAARRAMEEDDESLRALAAYRPTRRVITAYLVSSSVSYEEATHTTRSRRWLQAVQDAGVVEPEDADEFALMAYQAGNFELAGRWLAMTRPDSIAGLWLKAKLKLRDGDLDAAAGLLADAVRQLPERLGDEGGRRNGNRPDGLEIGDDVAAKRVRGELGVLRVQRREYVEALDLLLRAGYWADAAYVADRLLTLSELTTYVDANWPPPRPPKESNARTETKPDPATTAEDRHGEDIRYLLARRLTRANRFAEARPYFPTACVAWIDELVEHLVEANYESHAAGVRAAAYWAASKLVREKGMELFGTALEPDWQIYDGMYEDGGPTHRVRSDIPKVSILHPNAEEDTRFAAAAPNPDHRFHYRYLAANLAWKAAELMPDQSDETARVLCTAGDWLKARDPKYANLFYKALVIRCGHTELGTAADRKRWFPQMNDQGRLAEPMPPPVHTTYSGPWAGDGDR